jgi:dephospho-CoA kinase
MKKIKPFIVGISGHLGSGKSTALKIFSKNGFDAIDADRVVHSLYEEGKDGYRKINDFFGEQYILKSGRVNRKKLGKDVFSNTAKLHILEKLIHPLVYNEINKILDKSVSKYVFVEAVTLDQKKLIVPIKYFIWIDVDPKIGYKRFTRKRKISFNEYKKILGYQKKPEKVDFVIKNNGTKLEFKNKVTALIKKI